jgi:hypothetical protein
LKCKIAEKIKSENKGEFPINVSDPSYISNILFLSSEEYKKNYALLTEQDSYTTHLVQFKNIMNKRKIQI